MNGGGAVQSLSHGQLFAIPWTASRQAPLSFMISWSLLKPMSIESAMPSNHLTLCRPLLLLPSIFPSIHLPSIFPSILLSSIFPSIHLPSIFPSIRAFSNDSVLHITWPKYWSFSFSISPSNGYSGLIASRMDWFDLLAVQGTLKSLKSLNGF